MNNRENDDELERMRARARRDGVRQGGGRSYQRPAQPARERISTRQSYDGHDEYFPWKTIWTTNLRCPPAA